MEFIEKDDISGTQYFKDDYDVECSIQQSSSIVPHVWLGVHTPEISIMWKDAQALGLNLPKKYPETNERGWCDYPIPDKCLVASRMHLNREQAAVIAAKLQHFAATGTLPREEWS